MFLEVMLSGDYFDELVEAIGAGTVGMLSQTCPACDHKALWVPDEYWAFRFYCGQEQGDYFARYPHIWEGVEWVQGDADEH